MRSDAYGIVSFAVDTPFGEFERVGAMLDSGDVIDLRNAYHGFLECERSDPQAAAIAGVRIPASTFAFVNGGQPAQDAARQAIDFAMKTGARVEATSGSLQLSFKPTEIRILPALRPGKMVCTGRNYRAHQEEMGTPTFDDFPRGFIKVNSTLLAHDADLALPQETSELDFEAELAIVIGKRVHNVKPGEALDCVYGYTVFNDLTARDWQRSESRNGNHLLGKNLDGLGPLGPAIVPKEFVPDPTSLAVKLRVNGITRQDANTSGMIFDVPTLIAHWSKMTLEPGDLIATGTPEGTAAGLKPPDPAAFLKSGDVVEAEVGGVGILRTRIV